MKWFEPMAQEARIDPVELLYLLGQSQLIQQAIIEDGFYCDYFDGDPSPFQIFLVQVKFIDQNEEPLEILIDLIKDQEKGMHGMDLLNKLGFKI